MRRSKCLSERGPSSIAGRGNFSSSNMLKAVIINFNDLLTPLYSTFEQAELTDITDPHKKPDCLIQWTDYPQDSKMISLAALQQGVPTFMVQHGRRAMRDYWTHRGEPSSLACFVWGNKDKEDAITGMWGPEQVFRVGAPWLAYRPKERQEEKGLVVYDVPHWNVDTREAIMTWTRLKKIKGIRPVAKLIAPSNQNRNNYPGEQCLTYRNEPGHIEATYDLVKRASVVVCMMESTLELFAHSLGVPVVHVKGFKHKELPGTWQGVEDTLPGKGSLETDLKGLEGAIEMVINNPTLLAKDARERLIEDAGDPENDTPIQSITTIIGEIVKRYKENPYKPANMFDIKDSYAQDSVI